jgi:hypothetical protein
LYGSTFERHDFVFWGLSYLSAVAFIFPIFWAAGCLVADPEQAVPICAECKAAVSRKRPVLPKYALANDLWMGKLPAPLRGLSKAAWMLLPLARPFIQKYTCYPDGQTRGDPSGCIKGFVGNVAAFAQEGGSLLRSLPPKACELAERLLIAFVGSESDLKRAYIAELAVDISAFRGAFDCLRAVNAVYERVIWDDEAAAALVADKCALGMPKALAECLRVGADDARREPARQEGPADAVVDGQDCDGIGAARDERVDQERDEFTVGIDDADMQLDVDKQMQNAEVLLRKQVLRAHELKVHEASVRASAPAAMGNYIDRAGRDDLQANSRRLKAILSKAKVAKLRTETEDAVRKLEPNVPPPSGRSSASWLDLASGRQVVVVPTARDGMNAFDPSIWTSVDPQRFVYGDGVYGIERRVRLSYREWVAYLAARDELVYIP